MSNELYFRLLGQRPLSEYPGDPVPVASWLESRKIGAGSGFAIGPTIGGQYRNNVSIQVDPPAGGFAIDDVLFDMPSTLDFQSVVTSSSVFPQNFFFPGIYRVRSEFIWNVAAGATDAFYWQCITADNTAPGPLARAPLPSTGSSRWTFMRGGTPSLVRSWQAEFIAQENWKLLLRARTALPDVSVISLVDVQVECIFPLDRPTGQ